MKQIFAGAGGFVGGKGTVIAGQIATETSSLYYDGTLLPVGNTNRLKNKGKDGASANLLVQSGQGKMFNGTSQYINSGVIPNASAGTIDLRFTYLNGAVSRTAIGSSNVYIWINASGKIEAQFGNATLLCTDTIIANRSYKATLSYSGLNATLYADGVIKATGTATSFAPTLPLAIGARLTAITPTLDRYFNSVEQDVSIYNVALTQEQITKLYQYPEAITTNTAGGIVPDIGNVDDCVFYAPLSVSDNTHTNEYNITTATPTAMPIVNFTASCVDSAKKLADGQQYIALKRDALGIVTGKESGLHFDYNKSVNKITTNYLLPASPEWIIEAIVYIDGVSSPNYNKFIYGSVALLATIERVQTTTNTVGINVRGVGYNLVGDVGYHYIMIDAKGEIWVDGVLKNSGTPNTVTPIDGLAIGGEPNVTRYSMTNQPMIRIHKGTQYAKFNVAKAWQKAQKIIATLGV